MVVIDGMLLVKKRCVEVDVASCFRRGSPTCSVNKWLLGERREIVGKLLLVKLGQNTQTLWFSSRGQREDAENDRVAKLVYKWLITKFIGTVPILR